MENSVEISYHGLDRISNQKMKNHSTEETFLYSCPMKQDSKWPKMKELNCASMIKMAKKMLIQNSCNTYKEENGVM